MQEIEFQFGQAMGVCMVLVLACELKMGTIWRIAFVLAAVGVVVGTWFIPNLAIVLVGWFGSGGFSCCIVGLLIPVAIAFGVYFAFRYARTSGR